NRYETERRNGGRTARRRRRRPARLRVRGWSVRAGLSWVAPPPGIQRGPPYVTRRSASPARWRPVCPIHEGYAPGIRGFAGGERVYCRHLTVAWKNSAG